MKHYRIRFGFSRGRRGDVVKLSEENAQWLADCGLIDPEPLSDAEAAEPRERAVVTPEVKEGGHVRGATPGRRKRRAD